MNLQNKFPKFLTAGKQLGSSILNKNIKVLNGIHDSNASYLLFKNQSFKKFTLISSGTWFIIINNAAKKNILKPLTGREIDISLRRKVKKSRKSHKNPPREPHPIDRVGYRLCGGCRPL